MLLLLGLWPDPERDKRPRARQKAACSAACTSTPKIVLAAAARSGAACMVTYAQWRLEEIDRELAELNRQVSQMTHRNSKDAGCMAAASKVAKKLEGAVLLARGPAESVSIAAAGVVKVQDDLQHQPRGSSSEAVANDPHALRPWIPPAAVSRKTRTDQDALHDSANKDHSLKPYDIYFNESPMHTATLLLMSAAWQVLGFSMGLEHDSDDAVSAKSIAGRVVVSKAYACIEVVHLILLFVIHRYAPLKWKRLIFIFTSHMLWIVQFRVAAPYIHPLWFERRFDLLHASLYTVFQVMIGATIQEPWPWLLVAMAEPPLCWWSLDLKGEGSWSEHEIILYIVSVMFTAFFITRLSSPAARPDVDAVLVRVTELQAQSTTDSDENLRLHRLVEDLKRLKRSELLKTTRGHGRPRLSSIGRQLFAMAPIVETPQEHTQPKALNTHTDARRAE